MALAASSVLNRPSMRTQSFLPTLSLTCSTTSRGMPMLSMPCTAAVRFSSTQYSGSSAARAACLLAAGGLLFFTPARLGAAADLLTA